MFELLIEHEKKLYQPPVIEGCQWTTERSGSAGKLTFSILVDKVQFTEGDAVRLRVNKQNVFYGWIFTMKRTKDNKVDITAYDQLRYLKNKDTYVFENKTATEIIQMIANDFNLQCGELEPTQYINASVVESNSTLFDMIGNALNQELTNKGEMFILYDDFGKITLKNLANMKVQSNNMYLLIDQDTAEDFDYQSSIDTNTYDKIKLIYENEETGKRDVYIAQDSSNMNQWGVLQYFDTLKKGENGQTKADQLLKLYNKKTMTLKVNNAFGDVRVRGGSMLVVKLNLGNKKISHFMIVQKVTHIFNNDHHVMSMNLFGGDFNA